MKTNRSTGLKTRPEYKAAILFGILMGSCYLMLTHSFNVPKYLPFLAMILLFLAGVSTSLLVARQEANHFLKYFRGLKTGMISGLIMVLVSGIFLITNDIFFLDPSLEQLAEWGIQPLVGRILLLMTALWLIPLVSFILMQYFKGSTVSQYSKKSWDDWKPKGDRDDSLRGRLSSS